MTDIMLDLETFSVRPDATILVIGAIKFKRGEKWSEQISEKELLKRDTFYTRINIDSCIKEGFRIDSETQQWWSQQDEDIQYDTIEHPDRKPIKEALLQFKKWFGNEAKTCIWGNGSSFDCGILGEAYKKCGITAPWKFWMERDLRTLMDLGGIRMYDLPQYGKHNAIYDCYRQIIGFQRAENRLFSR